MPFLRSSRFSTLAMCHLASQRVHIIHGFPGTSPETLWYSSFCIPCQTNNAGIDPEAFCHGLHSSLYYLISWIKGSKEKYGCQAAINRVIHGAVGVYSFGEPVAISVIKIILPPIFYLGGGSAQHLLAVAVEEDLGKASCGQKGGVGRGYSPRCGSRPSSPIGQRRAWEGPLWIHVVQDEVRGLQDQVS